jgi:hypothetical protein
VMQDQPLIVARPSIVVGHTRLGCRPSASIFWYYRSSRRAFLPSRSALVGVGCVLGSRSR